MNNMTDNKSRKVARKIAMNIEMNEYEPTDEEKALLIAEGFMEKEEVKGTVIIDASDVIVEISKRKTITMDGNVMEILGMVEHLEVNEDRNGAEIVIRDCDDERHEVSITGEFVGKSTVRALFYMMNGEKYQRGMKIYDDMSNEEKLEEIENLISLKKVGCFRTIMKDGIREIFATVSLKYVKAKIEELLPAINEICKTNDIEVHASTGTWGGSAIIQFNKDEISQFKIIVDGNILDGRHAISINVGGMILKCSNQMVFEVQKLIGKMLPNFTFAVRSVHSGNIEAFKEKLQLAVNEIDKFQEMIGEAKNINITKEEQDKILKFYNIKNVISKKTIKDIAHILDDEEIQQAPGTLWGLAMVLTYAGTHMEFNDGVKYALKKTGGELLCVSSVWEAYMELVETTIINDVKDEEEEEEDE